MRRTALIDAIRLSSFLSFGRRAKFLELKPLNVIIGPNGTGKSNLIDAIDLLRALPTDIGLAVRKAGGAEALVNTRATSFRTAEISVKLSRDGISEPLYSFAFTSQYGRFAIQSEGLEEGVRPVGAKQGTLYFAAGAFGAFVSEKDGRRRVLDNGDYDPGKSILNQLRDPTRYAVLTRVANDFASIRIYRDWAFGRNAQVRRPCDIALPSDFLLPDCSNLGLVLSDLLQDFDMRKTLIERISVLYPGISDFVISVTTGSVQVFLREGDCRVPLPRLSDGTIRYLCLLVILCHPNPPPLVCIEEPELGLHPDVIPHLADLLKAASKRCQLIVTTHSDILIDALSDAPDAVLVAERAEGGETTIERLKPQKLRLWLEKYRLGQLWLRGEIGGVSR